MTELAVLVSVLNRPQNVAPLVESFLAHCPADARLKFLATTGYEAEIDAINAVVEDRVNLRVDTQVTWPEKINVGVQTNEADWYLCGADDIAFTPGWWEATEELRDDPNVGVIGTNDSATGTGNPRVAAGDHTCHPLIRAAYIQQAGTADRRGIAVHPGYRHWFVDDELIWTAKSRGAWAYCKNAVIEHNHPYWKPDQVEWDDTYTLGEAHAEEDKALFLSRAHLFGVEVR